MRRTTQRLADLIGPLYLLLGSAASAGAGFDDARIAEIRYPEWFNESLLDLREDLAEARAAGKQGLFLFFSTQGCSYCHLFIETSLSDPVLAARLREHFDSIGLEIFDDAELVDFAGEATRVNAFALSQGVQFAPTLMFFGLDGERLLRLSGYYDPERFARALDYLIAGHYRDRPWTSWLAGKGASRTPSAGQAGLLPDPLFSEPPYALDRTRVRAARPLLVLFERTDCPACLRFHREVLADPQVRSVLEAFDVVRLDADDTSTPILAPSGERTSPATWLQALGFTQVPALVFFDEGGQQVLATDALVLKNRMMNSLGFVTERAYERGWTYQRFARSRALARSDGGVQADD